MGIEVFHTLKTYWRRRITIQGLVMKEVSHQILIKQRSCRSDPEAMLKRYKPGSRCKYLSWSGDQWNVGWLLKYKFSKSFRKINFKRWNDQTLETWVNSVSYCIAEDGLAENDWPDGRTHKVLVRKLKLLGIVISRTNKKILGPKVLPKVSPIPSW